MDDFSCSRNFQTEYGSQHLLASGKSVLTNNISEKSFRVIKQENLDRIIITHLNINSIRNKFDFLTNKVIGNDDVVFISERKLAASFSIGQFKISGFSAPFNRDRDQYGGDLLIFVRKDIPIKHLSSEIIPIMGNYIELNLVLN